MKKEEIHARWIYDLMEKHRNYFQERKQKKKKELGYFSFSRF